MKPITILASLASLGLSAAFSYNETHTWYISELDIRHQIGLPSSVQFLVTDGLDDSAPTIGCSMVNDDAAIINSTLIPDVNLAVCDDPNWAFFYVSVAPEKDEDDDVTVPLGGKLIIGQTVNKPNITMPSNFTEDPTFIGTLVLEGHDFQLWERYIDYSALLYYGGPESFTITATLAVNGTNF